MKLPLKYVVEDVDRHGNVRLYYRRRGQPKIRLRSPPGSPEFMVEYQSAVNGPSEAPGGAATKLGHIIPGSFTELCVKYYESSMYQKLSNRTQYVRRSILERFCQNHNDGDKPYKSLKQKHIRMRRDDMMDRPEAANGMVKAIRQVYKFASRYDLHDQNPAAGVEFFSGSAEGVHSWSLGEIEKFESVHPVGSSARLALALALYTAQRRADLVQLGRQHVRDGWLCFTQHKNRNLKPIRMEIPIIPELQRIIDQSPTGDLTFLVTAFNRPFTSNGFGNRFRKWCDEAGLNHCSVHGLRKAAAARLAELGCTEQEIMAITGHRTSKEVVRYTRAASQKIRAESALRRMSAGQILDKKVPLSTPKDTGGTQTATNPKGSKGE